jgi:hypothetical protein
MMRPIDPHPAEFQIVRDHMENHPSRTGYYVLWNGPMFLDVGLPFGQNFARFTLAAFPNGTWIDLQDLQGRPIPVSIRIDQGIIWARWL